MFSRTKPTNYVWCTQNHDQIGNRALGERLGHQIEAAMERAVNMLLLLSPYMPMIFMGQEWSASSPFLYFTDHNRELGKLVVKGRRDEFKQFSHFTDPAMRHKIPSPQDRSTFEKSRLKWHELDKKPHAQFLNLYRDLLKLRHFHPALRSPNRANFSAQQLSDSVLRLVRKNIEVVVNLGGAACVDVPKGGRRELISTENRQYATDPRTIVVLNTGSRPQVAFERAGAVAYLITRSKQAKGK
jgi:maltooligosyltrehalose trehalohydrolase